MGIKIRIKPVNENGNCADFRTKSYPVKIPGSRNDDQGIKYEPNIVDISGCGFFFPFPVPSDGVLSSMKIATMLARSKGRDFYD